MSHTEAPELTVARFIQTPAWATEIDERSLAAQLISVSKETNRKPDVSYFEVIDGVLMDPITNKPILNQIKRDTPLDEVEYQIGVQLQDWAAQNDSGIAKWISSRFPKAYPCEKMSIHTIAYKLKDGKLIKVVLNSYILFDAIFENPEEIRKFIFTEEDREEAIPEILSWIQKVSKKSVDITTTNQEQTERMALHFVRRIRSGVHPDIIAEEMRQRGFLGQNAISCPGGGTSFSDLLSSHSEGFVFASGEDQHGSLEFPCPHCGAINTRPFGQLISNCHYCGGNVSC